MTFEVEQKFYVDDLPALESRLRELDAEERAAEEHRDTYFRHPCRDFAETSEALRLRRIDGQPRITYKGPKLPGDVKARRELEWRLDPHDPHGKNTAELWQLLGFEPLRTVAKRRRAFSLPQPNEAFEVVIDEVESLGTFAEIELVVDSQTGVDDARNLINKLASELGLNRREARSYLRMCLEAAE